VQRDDGRVIVGAAPAAPTTTPDAPTAPPETPTATPETPKLPNIEDLTRLFPPYKVLLHNDDHNSMDHVVRSLLRSVPKLSRIRAVQIMIEAHNSGVALVIVCPLEQAELFRDRLESCGLTATIEAA
jgi:ATP-dependent Clp protease adaptor protein ClpS